MSIYVHPLKGSAIFIASGSERAARPRKCQNSNQHILCRRYKTSAAAIRVNLCLNLSDKLTLFQAWKILLVSGNMSFAKGSKGFGQRADEPTRVRAKHHCERSPSHQQTGKGIHNSLTAPTVEGCSLLPRQTNTSRNLVTGKMGKRTNGQASMVWSVEVLKSPKRYHLQLEHLVVSLC